MLAGDRLIEDDIHMLAELSLTAFERDRLLSGHQSLAAILLDLFRQMLGQAGPMAYRPRTSK